MPDVHGKNTYFQIEDATGASRNLSGDGNTVSMTESVNNPATTRFGDNTTRRAGSGINDAKWTYDGWFSQSASENARLLTAMKGTRGLLVWGPAGSGANNIRYSASVLIDDAAINSPVDGIVTLRASFSIAAGSVTTGSF